MEGSDGPGGGNGLEDPEVPVGGDRPEGSDGPVGPGGPEGGNGPEGSEGILGPVGVEGFDPAGDWVPGIGETEGTTGPVGIIGPDMDIDIEKDIDSSKVTLRISPTSMKLQQK